MNRDTVSGKFDQMKGKVKQSVGEATGNERMANSGTADQVKGAAKEGWGSMKDAVKTPESSGGTRSEMGRDDTRDELRGDSARSTGHDVREKIASTAQNVKNSVKNKADDIKYKHSA